MSLQLRVPHGAEPEKCYVAKNLVQMEPLKNHNSYY
jgi:hypothetical protein